MRIAITGASGLIGTALAASLRSDGHHVVALVRRPATGPDEAFWDPDSHRLDPTSLSNVDGVVHLAGAGIGDRRWTSSYQAALLRSRVEGTGTISEAISRAEPRPRVLLSASAIGYYGDTGDRAVDERSGPGSDFLAEVCVAWEGATAAAEAAGTRVVRLRTGLVCSPRGGFLGRQLPLFRLGLGGRLGSGRQYWSWISLHDQVRAIRFLLEDEMGQSLHGPVNLTGPDPVTNAEFTGALGRAVHRPTVAPVPAVALRIVLGKFAPVGVLAGQRVMPRALESAGFIWQHPTVDSALEWVVRQRAAPAR